MLCATLLLVASASESIAQDADEPLRLIPAHQNEADDGGSEPGGADNTVSDAELGVEVEQVAAPESSASESAEPGIQVGSLEAIDPDAAGVLLPGIEPFSGDFWSGSRRSRIEALLPRLPAAAPSGTMRRLALSLLTSPAQPPAGPGEAGALVLARVGRLVAMGARDAALALLESAGLESGPTLSARIENDRHLAALDLDAACEQILGKAGRAGDGYWRRVRISLSGQRRPDRSRDAGPGAPARGPMPRPIKRLTTRSTPWRGWQSRWWTRSPIRTPLRVRRLAACAIPDLCASGGEGGTRCATGDRRCAGVAAGATAAGGRARGGGRNAHHRGPCALFIGRWPSRRMSAPMPWSRSNRWSRTLGRSLMFQAIEEQTRASPCGRKLLAAALSLAEAQGAHGTTARALAHLVRTVPPAPEHGWFSGAAGRALDGSRGL